MHADEADKDAFWARLNSLISFAEDFEQLARVDADYPAIHRWAGIARDLRVLRGK